MKQIYASAQKILSILLSLSVLFNSAIPAFSQVHPAIISRTSVIVNDRIVNEPQRLQRQMETRVIQNIQGDLSKEQLFRIFEIRDVFLNTSKDGAGKTDFEQFQELYKKEIDNAFAFRKNELEVARRKAQKEIDEQVRQERLSLVREVTKTVPGEPPALQASIKGFLKNTKNSLLADIQNLAAQYPADSEAGQLLVAFAQNEQIILDWQAQNNNTLAAWYEEGLADLNRWKKQAQGREKQVFEKEYSAQLLKEREAFVKQAVSDLWELKDKTDLAHEALLETAPVILPMRTLNNQSFFSQQQRQWLLNEYVRILNKCTRDPADKECNLMVSVLSGISSLSSSRNMAAGIRRFLEKISKTQQAASFLLTGVAALLGMQQYDEVSLFIEQSTRQEHNLSNIDLMSFEALVNALANSNGQYLGEVSKFGQYALSQQPTEQSPRANIWEDIALLLAQEGSAESLSMLKTYGVQQCRVSYEKQLSGPNKYVVRCAGIVPFLLGALIGGKSGADQYHLTHFNTQPGPVLMGNGSTHIITPQEANRNAQRLKNLESNYYAYAASMNLTPAAMLARHLFLQSMGDLNAESELRIDDLLYKKVYKPEIKKKSPKSEFAISPYDRNSSAFHAKQARQSRTGVFRIVGRVADVALLVWCLIDITKWAYSGAKLGYAITKMSRMARNGISAAERLAFLHKLNIPQRKLYNATHVFSNIRNKISMPVLAVAPQFGVESLRLAPLAKNTGELLAENLRFSRTTGELTLVGIQGLRQQGVSPLTIHQTRQTLATATLRTNETFTPAGWFGNNRAYKTLLAQNLNQALITSTNLRRADINPLMAQIRTFPVKAPQIPKNGKNATKKPTPWPLMVATGLSLSSASSALIVPLENTYGDQITETDKMWITLGLPYLPSLASAFIVPFVKKFGALNVFKTSLWISMGGLATAGAAGFYGNIDKENLPPLWPLFVSGTAIGVSAALSRASLNKLIDNLGGGGSLLQSMLFKNAGSFLLLLPPMAANLIATNTHWFEERDFSFAFPTLAALSFATLKWISSKHYSTSIGQTPGFMPLKSYRRGQPLTWPGTFLANTGKVLSGVHREGWSSMRLLGTREILPIILATTAFTGFEAASLNKAGNQLFKLNTRPVAEKWGKSDLGKDNWTSLLTTGGTMLAPLIMRYFAPNILKGISSSADQMAQYRRMLAGSYVLNITGAGLLYANGTVREGPDGQRTPNWIGLAGLGLLGLGTANVTQSFQKIAQYQVVRSRYLTKKISGLTKTAQAIEREAAHTSMMTTFSTSQVGLALVPLIVSNYTDHQKEDGVLTRDDAPRSSLWIPLSSIGLSFLLAGPSIKLLPRFSQIPTGLIGISKGILGSYPQAFKNTTSFGQDILQRWNLLPTPQPNFPQGFVPLPNLPKMPEPENLEDKREKIEK